MAFRTSREYLPTDVKVELVRSLSPETGLRRIEAGGLRFRQARFRRWPIPQRYFHRLRRAANWSVIPLS